jgi:hypothetical protein
MQLELEHLSDVLLLHFTHSSHEVASYPRAAGHWTFYDQNGKTTDQVPCFGHESHRLSIVFYQILPCYAILIPNTQTYAILIPDTQQSSFLIPRPMQSLFLIPRPYSWYPDLCNPYSWYPDLCNPYSWYPDLCNPYSWYPDLWGQSIQVLSMALHLLNQVWFQGSIVMRLLTACMCFI